MKTQLSDSLDRYQGLEPVQSADAGSERRWGVYAAAAGSALAMSGAADADIIYSGVQNVTVQQGGTLSTNIDVDGGGADLIIWLNLQGSSSFANLQGNGGALQATSSAVVKRFASGFSIGNGTTAFTNNFSTLRGTDSAGAQTGMWNLSTNGIAGFQLGSGDFGWIRLHVESTDADAFPDKLTAVDWAYDNTGAAIAAGDTGAPSGVPAPASLALLATGAVGVTALRRRRTKRGSETGGELGRDQPTA